MDKSWGAIRVSRIVGGGQRLFDSSLSHSVTIGMEISEAEISGSTDQVHPRARVLEIRMSEAQWARMVSSVGSVPTAVTFTYRDGEHVQLGSTGKKTQSDYKEEFSDLVAGSLEGIRNLSVQVRELSDSKKIPKSVSEEILSRLSSIHMGLRSNLPFLAQKFDECTNKSVEEAKCEIHAAAQAYERSGVQSDDMQRITKLNGDNTKLSNVVVRFFT